MKRLMYLVLLMTSFIYSGFTQEDKSTELMEKIQYEFKKADNLIKHYSSIKDYREDGINLNPGISPDGDEQGVSAFTHDGNRIFTTNGLTNNVTVLDWVSQSAIANIDVGEYPVHVSITEDVAIISCLFDSSLYVLDINDYSVLAILELPGQTFSSTVSPDGSTVYGHCFNGDHSTVEVFSLDNFSNINTIDNLPALPYLQSWITGSGRVNLTFFSFIISFANDLLITPDADNEIIFYDLNTGSIVGQIAGIKSYETELSMDENTLITITVDNPGTLYQIDVSTQTITDDFPLSIGYWAGSLSCNADGTRAFFGGDNKGHIIDFSDDTHVEFSTNIAFGSETTSDKRYIYSSNYKAAVLDFETKSVIGIHQGNTQGYCIVSPVGYKAFAYNSLFWEGGFFYDFSNLNSLDYIGKQFFGNPPEGDIPTRVAITPDGSKAVVTNPGSWTISIVDLNNNLITSVLDLGESCKFVVLTHDGNWAIASGYDDNTVKVIDLNTEEVVAYDTTNQRPGNMIISPDDQYVYVMNIKGNTISKVLLDGENSIEVEEMSCGTIGGSYSAYGIYSDLEITPDGKYLVACISFENHVKIIDTETMTTVAQLNTADFPLKVAINADGDYATVTNISADSYTVIHVDGANSSVVSNQSHGLGNPIRVKYNPVQNFMSIVDYQHTNMQWKVLHTDPETGNLIDTEIHDGYGATLDVGYHGNGTPVILTGAQPLPGGDYGDSHVLIDGQAFIIGPGPIAFDVNPVTNIAVCACGGGGPDYISIVYLDPVNVSEDSKLGEAYRFYPNPAKDLLSVSSASRMEKIEIFDVSGNLISSYHVSNKEYTLPVHALPSGLYIMRITCNFGVISTMKIIKQ